MKYETIEKPIEPLLKAENLCKSYRNGPKVEQAVRKVSLKLNAGEVLAFLGANGAGKTTTIKMVAGLIHPDAGIVEVAGENPLTNPYCLRLIGAVLEGSRNIYWRLTALENLEYFGVLRGLSLSVARRRALKLLEQFNLKHKRDVLAQNLSRGMQQKLAIAVALVHQPKLLLLDEPTLGLDVEATQHVKALVRAIASSGCAILLTTHQLDVAEELSSSVAIIQKGEIVANKPTSELIKEYSSDAYIISVEGSNDSQKIDEIKALLGAQVEVYDNRIIYRGELEGLYSILDCLRPLPIQVTKERSDLTEVFLQVI
ncbi:MAG TPA: ABC transporter ATP-binding protein [Cyanobacteria bacterium UBA8543]|nr:ABC transporter ATP-binding protein [Cyanobacteria bacterium UBA8543]